MGKANFIILLTALLASHAEGFTLALSPSYQFESARDLSLSPQLGAQLLFGKLSVDQQDVSISVRHTKPLATAHEIIVKKFWNRELATLEKMGEKNSAHDCKESAKGVFECMRAATTHDKLYVYERLVWNSKKDLISLRVSSKNPDAAKKIFAEIHGRSTP